MLPVMFKRSYPYHRDWFFGNNSLSSLFSDGADYTVPAVNISENDDRFAIEVAAPGLSKEDFSIKVENNVLTISSEKENKKEDETQHYMRKEFSFQSFSRSFSLPKFIDLENVKASHKDGILTVELPKMDEAKAKPTKEIKIS